MGCQMTEQLVQIHQLRTYAACPNLAKYSWHVPVVSKKNLIRTVIESCYRDLAVLDKRVNWKTVRNRIHNHLLKVEPNLSTDNFYSSAISIMESVRNWYIDSFRDQDGEAICNIKLEDTIREIKIEATIDIILIKRKQITLVEFTEADKPEKILRDIGLRTKIYLLGKQNIKVNKILAIKCTDRAVRTWSLSIDNSNTWNYKTYQVLQLMLFSIKNKIFYPSVTSACVTCKYKEMCGW